MNERPKTITITCGGVVRQVITLPELPQDVGEVSPDPDDTIAEEIARVFGDDPEAA